jgi:signal transduction histidine kinase
MKIKNQFLICIVIFSVVLLVITTSAAITDRDVRQLNNQGLVAGKIERSVSSLSRVAIDYFLYQEDFQLSRWNSIHASLHSEMSETDLNNAQQQNVINLIDDDLHGLNETFNAVVSYLQAAPRNVSVRIEPKFQFIWSDMGTKSEKLASDASQLSLLINEQTRQTQMTNTLLILSLVVTFGALLATVLIIVFQRTLKGVTELQKGIDTIGSGNLNYIIQTRRHDEISELSHSFNEMTAKLKTVTASKADLEKEIAERKKAEEILKARTEQLEHTQKKLEENARTLKVYGSQMEDLAKERANQLQGAERLAAIGATASMVGHDMRNPLQAISGDLYFAKKDLEKMPESQLQQSIKESLTSAEESVTYLNKIVQDLQDYASPIKLTMQQADLEELCTEVLFRREIPSNISASCHVEKDAKNIWTDALLLKRILNNLTSNAVQAMPNGGKLTLLARRNAEEFILTIEDTGAGIPQDLHKKLFTPMFTTKAKGQGFGLVVVKRMTEALGGKVTFETEPGVGSKFHIHLPQTPK